MTVNYAHRGASGYYPENTMLAFRKAVEMGCTGIETDVQMTRDGVLVLIHDESVNRTTDTFISVSFLIFAIPAGILGTKLGKKKTISIGVAGLLLCFLIISFMMNINIIRGLFVVCGFFWALININSYSFVTDMAPRGQIGTYTGLYYFSSSIAAIVSPPLLGGVIDIFGYKYMFLYGTLFFALAQILILNVKNVKNQLEVVQ